MTMAKKTEKKAAPPQKGAGKATPAAPAAPKAPAVEAKAAPAPAPAAVEAKPAPVAAAASAPEQAKTHGFRRKLVGRVTSDKMDKTVTVEVIRNALDPVYKKYIRQRARYKAHDEKNQYKVGDRVEIQEHRPISREKRWLVTRLVARPVEE